MTENDDVIRKTPAGIGPADGVTITDTKPAVRIARRLWSVLGGFNE